MTRLPRWLGALALAVVVAVSAAACNSSQGPATFGTCPMGYPVQTTPGVWKCVNQ